MAVRNKARWLQGASDQARRTTRLFTRNGYDISRRHRAIICKLSELQARRFVIDGELVVLDNDGRSKFARLMFGKTATHYIAFDLVLLNGLDLTCAPNRWNTANACCKS